MESWVSKEEVLLSIQTGNLLKKGDDLRCKKYVAGLGLDWIEGALLFHPLNTLFHSKWFMIFVCLLLSINILLAARLVLE